MAGPRDLADSADHASGFANRPLRDFSRVWNLPNNYDAFPAFLVARGLMTSIRIEIVVTILVIGTEPLLFQLGRGADAHRPSLVIATIIAAIGAVWAALFARSKPWPKKSISLLFVATTCVFMLVSALLMPIAYLGLAQCTAYALICGYVVFFHGPRVFVLVFVFVVLGIGAVAIDEILAGLPILQIVSLAAAVVVIVGTLPVMTLLVMSLVAPDAEASHVDELTGALNRRGLEHHVRGSIRDGARDITVFVLDIDAFKTVNDTYGHSTGDSVLVAVTYALQASVTDEAVARLGGEEFAVVRTVRAQDPLRAGELLCAAVRSASNPPVTASVGVASLTLASHADPERALTELNRLITAADHAMYRAKKAGGNRVHVGP